MKSIDCLSLQIVDDPIQVGRQAAAVLEQLCSAAIAGHGAFNIAISGGKTPIPLFQLLASPEWNGRFSWEKINLYWADERCVGPDQEQSNYRMARDELLSHVALTNFYRIRGEMDPQEGASAYERLLRTHFNLAYGELPRFDCILLGLGADGHVASIFPGSSDAVLTERLVVDQYVSKLRSSRITLTLPVINNAAACVFLVSGREKHDALSRTLDLLTTPELPAQKVRPSNGRLVWIVDEAAAQG